MLHVWPPFPIFSVFSTSLALCSVGLPPFCDRACPLLHLQVLMHLWATHSSASFRSQQLLQGCFPQPTLSILSHFMCSLSSFGISSARLYENHDVLCTYHPEELTYKNSGNICEENVCCSDTSCPFLSILRYLVIHHFMFFYTDITTFHFLGCVLNYPYSINYSPCI